MTGVDLLMRRTLNSPLLKQIELPIEGMTCAACASRIEKNLNQLPSVQAAVNFASEKARVSYDESQIKINKLISAIEKAGFHIIPPVHTTANLQNVLHHLCRSYRERVK